MVVKMMEEEFPPCASCNADEHEAKPKDTDTVAVQSCAVVGKCVNACAAYGRVCPCASRLAAYEACKAMAELTTDSLMFPSEKLNFVCLRPDDIVVGEKLGEGGFSNVNDCIISVGEEAGRKFAVKYLKRQAMVDVHHFKHGAADLAVEACFLQQLNHPHIIKLHGVTAGSLESNVASGRECGFFIVVDHLCDTLEKRIDRWREEKERSHGGLISYLTGELRERRREELKERIRIAYAIADAMEYLHSMNVIFRDLKPDNIGFDEDDVLKIFDFGLAKELKVEQQREEGTYALTGKTGSRRYMAPEVAQELPYEKSVDVYSFGILLWELCSAEKPFFGYSSNKHMNKVILGGERPRMDSKHTADWPINLQWLMARCWSPLASLRPSFSDVKEILADILNGKESLPDRFLILTGDRGLNVIERDHKEYHDIGHSLAGIFRVPRGRSRTVGKLPSGASPTSEWKGIERLGKNARAKTWSSTPKR